MTESLRIWMQGKVVALTMQANRTDTPESARSRMLAEARAYQTALDMAEMSP